MGDDKKDLDGLAKNLDKMNDAKKRLLANAEMQGHLQRAKDSKFWSMGKDNYFHCWLNVVTEAARFEPYYIVHVLLYGWILTNVVMVAVLVAGLIWL